MFVPSEHKTIQAGIDAASAGDTLWVASGTYPGPIVLKKNLTLFGDGGPDGTILDGGDSVRVLHVEGVKNAALIGFRVQRGKAPGGGGIYCLRDTGFVVTGCDIRSNWESGVAIWQSWGISIADCDIRENQGSGVSVNNSIIYILRDKFVGNRGVAGGAMSFVSSQLIRPIMDTKFEGNRAEGGTGGAINADSSIVRFGACLFKDNSSSVAGGAIAAMPGSQAWLARTRFTGNHAATGGAVLADHATLNVVQCTFDKNRSAAAGTAVQILGRRLAGVNPIISNSTFYRNGASTGGGAAIFCQEASPEIRRNIFVTDSTNVAVTQLQSSPLYECNLVHTLEGRPVGPLPSANSLVGDPHFCDPENGDFKVRDLSPALTSPCGKIGSQDKGCATFKLIPSR